jgi:hypothetical protein
MTCCIFTTSNRSPSPEHFKRAHPDATIETTPDQSGRSWSRVCLRWTDCEVVLNRRDFRDPECIENVKNFSWHIFAELGNGEMNSSVWDIFYYASKCRQEIGVVGTPLPSASGSEWQLRVQRIAEELAKRLPGVIFIEDVLIDLESNLIIAKNEQPHPDRLPRFASAEERKKRSEQRLRELGLPIFEFLPTTIADEEALLRTAGQTVRRALCLLCVALRGQGLPGDVVWARVCEQGLEKHLSSEESAFLRDPSPSSPELMSHSWRCESVWILLWTLGFVEELGNATQMCDLGVVWPHLKGKSVQQIIDSCCRRPTSEILDLADQIYRMHWVIRDAKKSSQQVNANGDIIMEWHHAINWLVFHRYQDWDEVSTDT